MLYFFLFYPTQLVFFKDISCLLLNVLFYNGRFTITFIWLKKWQLQFHVTFSYDTPQQKRPKTDQHLYCCIALYNNPDLIFMQEYERKMR